MTAADQGIGDNPPPVRQAPDQLVAENERRPAKSAVPEKTGNVGTTNTSNLDGNFRLSGLPRRPGLVLNLNSARGGVDQRFHERQYI